MLISLAMYGAKMETAEQTVLVEKGNVARVRGALVCSDQERKTRASTHEIMKYYRDQHSYWQDTVVSH